MQPRYGVIRIQGTMSVAPLPRIRELGRYSLPRPSRERPGHLYHMIERPRVVSRRPDKWPRDIQTDHTSIPEKLIMPHQALTVSTRTPLLDVHKFSSYTNLLRVVAWILRFFSNLRPAEKTHGELTASDLQASLNQLLQMVQRDSIPAE